MSVFARRGSSGSTTGAFVIQNPTILDNGIVVPGGKKDDFASDRAKLIDVDQIVPEDPNKPIVFQADQGAIQRSTGVKAYITSMNAAAESYDVTSLGSRNKEYVQGPYTVTAEVRFILDDPGDLQKIMNMNAGCLVYLAPEQTRVRPSVPQMLYDEPRSEPAYTYTSRRYGRPPYAGSTQTPYNFGTVSQVFVDPYFTSEIDGVFPAGGENDPDKNRKMGT